MEKETLEEAAERIAKEHCNIRVNPNTTEFQIQQFIIKGAYWQAQRMYSEEDMRKAFEAGELSKEDDINGDCETPFDEWFEQFKKK